jgi:hypothetical protein
MPAYDDCQPQMMQALEKAGWTITKVSHYINHNGQRLYIDIFAKYHNQDVIQNILIVEVKCFPPAISELDELYRAIGQYLIYEHALQMQEILGVLYLAIPTHAYHGIFKKSG